MKHRKLMIISLIMSLCMSTFAHADEGVQGKSQCTKCVSKVQSDSYMERAGSRLLHGAANLVLSPVVLFTEPYHTVRCSDENVISGVASGIGNTVKYAVLGVWDLATFWVPGQTGKDLAVTECVCEHIKCCKS